MSIVGILLGNLFFKVVENAYFCRQNIIGQVPMTENITLLVTTKLKI